MKQKVEQRDKFVQIKFQKNRWNKEKIKFGTKDEENLVQKVEQRVNKFGKKGGKKGEQNLELMVDQNLEQKEDRRENKMWNNRRNKDIKISNCITKGEHREKKIQNQKKGRKTFGTKEIHFGKRENIGINFYRSQE